MKPTFRQQLQESKGKTLVEDTSHEYWGRGSTDTGLNMLGRLLMTLRENLPDSVQPTQMSRPRHDTRFSTQNRYPRRNDQQPRCYRCGEKSHNINTCRHASPLRCYCCNAFGHKQKFCIKNTLSNVQY